MRWLSLSIVPIQGAPPAARRERADPGELVAVAAAAPQQTTDIPTTTKSRRRIHPRSVTRARIFDLREPAVRSGSASAPKLPRLPPAQPRSGRTDRDRALARGPRLDPFEIAG